ncbi:hypothetical protein D3C73_1661240 [compost metagenome]
MGEHLPPAGLQNIRRRAEGGDEESQCRKQPDEADNAKDEVDHGFAAFAFLFADH